MFPEGASIEAPSVELTALPPVTERC